VSIAVTAAAAPIEMVVGGFAGAFGNWVQFSAGVNASGSAGWWMGGLLIAHIVLVLVTVRPEPATKIRRLSAIATAIGLGTSLLWGGVLLFLLALGGDSPRSSLSSAISIGVPFLHIGLFIAAVLIASRRPTVGKSAATRDLSR
jgi:hypothetical protein